MSHGLLSSRLQQGLETRISSRCPPEFLFPRTCYEIDMMMSLSTNHENWVDNDNHGVCPVSIRVSCYVYCLTSELPQFVDSDNTRSISQQFLAQIFPTARRASETCSPDRKLQTISSDRQILQAKKKVNDFVVAKL